MLERWMSGLSHTPGKRARGYTLRGFESRLLRHKLVCCSPAQAPKSPASLVFTGVFLLSAQWILPSTCSSSVSRVKALKLLNNDFTVQVAIGGVLKTNRLVAGAARQCNGVAIAGLHSCAHLVIPENIATTWHRLLPSGMTVLKRPLAP